MNYKTTIILHASPMELGDTLRVTCPRCEGGSSQEKNTLSITKHEDGSVVWQCFRNSCPEKGGTNTDGRVSKVDIVEPAKPKKKFDGTTKALTDFHLARIKKLWGIDDPPHWYFTPDYGGRIAMSVRGPKYNHRGWVLRDIRGAARVKALTYIEDNEESLSWYKTQDPSAPTVLVEDIPSAVRASRYTNAVALLGTAVGMDKALEIADYTRGPVVIALDQDATAKSFEYAQRYKLLWREPRVLLLERDLKDMEEEELCLMLQNLVAASK